MDTQNATAAAAGPTTAVYIYIYIYIYINRTILKYNLKDNCIYFYVGKKFNSNKQTNEGYFSALTLKDRRPNHL